MRDHFAPVGVRNTGPSDSGIDLAATERQQTAATFSRNPSFSAIWSALPARMASVPEPTLPRPTMPTFTSCIWALWHAGRFWVLGAGFWVRALQFGESLPAPST